MFKLFIILSLLKIRYSIICSYRNNIMSINYEILSKTNRFGAFMSLIDIIVGVKNEEKHIERCINSLRKQTIEDITIIVVDGISDDKTKDIVKKLMENDERIQLLINEKEIISSGRNIGLKASNADFVAYIDGHTYVKENWLEILYNTFLNYENECKLGGIGSTYAIPEDERILGKVIDFCFKTLFGGFGTSYTKEDHIRKVDTVAFALYKRSILDKMSIIYDEKMTHCEDTDFNYKLLKEGYILLKHPEAFVYQYKRQNLKDFFKQMFNYGAGRAKFIKKYPESMKIFILIPSILVIYFLFLIIILILHLINVISSEFVFLALIPAILYIIINILYTFISIKKFKNIKAALSFLLFPIEHIAYGIGFLRNYL